MSGDDEVYFWFSDTKNSMDPSNLNKIINHNSYSHSRNYLDNYNSFSQSENQTLEAGEK